MPFQVIEINEEAFKHAVSVLMPNMHDLAEANAKTVRECLAQQFTEAIII
jgi:hypothetical protein